MAHADTDQLIRLLITGDPTPADGLIAAATASNEPMDLVVAAIRHPLEQGLLAEALHRASSTKDRQVIAIASAFLAGETGRVDALAREHLVDHPDSVLVAWLAASASPHAATTPDPPVARPLEES